MPYTIPLGSADRLKKLYSYPNDPDDKTITLAGTIQHWFDLTLDRDGFKARNATASVRVEVEGCFLDIEGPAEVAGYLDRLPKFLNHGWEALGVIEQLKTSKPAEPWPEGLTRPTADKIWDPQGTGEWRFFLPLGMAMLRQRSLQFFHYPPIRLLSGTQDYLDDPVPVRWKELLEANGVSEDQNPLFNTVVDGAPVGAPDDQGTQYVDNEPPVHLIPIQQFHDYQRAQLELLLNTSSTSPNYTIPMVVYGSPAKQVFAKLYGVTLEDAPYDPRTPGGDANQAATVEIIPGKKTAVLGSGHPYRFYAQAQIDKETGADVGSGNIIPEKCERARQIMIEDLAAAGWQHRMAQDPTQDLQAVLAERTDYWNHPDRAAQVCALVGHEGSLLYPDPKSLQFGFRVSMQEAVALCNQRGYDPCAAAG